MRTWETLKWMYNFYSTYYQSFNSELFHPEKYNKKNKKRKLLKRL